MPNMFWYLLLLVFSIGLFAVCLIKDKRSFLPLWLFNSGLAYLFELIVYVVYNCYLYKPNVFHDSFIDSTFGSIFSQGLSVPIAAAFGSIYKIKARYVIVFALSFSLVEVLFLKLDVYELNWWRTSYTFLFIPVLFYISKAWYSLLKKEDRIVIIFTKYICMITISITVTWLLYALQPTVIFQTGLFAESSRDHTFANAIYSIGISVLYTAAAFSRKFIWKILYFFIILLADSILFTLHLLIIHNSIEAISLAAIHLFFISCSSLLKRVFFPNFNEELLRK
ncbi:hypothetical protein J9317_07115 [Metabacillus sp. KIGAM252]|uniref:Uncharacterized protein n=1 Tax=Metabacillus flavus TaxID=2823519 RepID=A0ABS5LD18_9BACI|nr:hypothetical protein [Metabacillus flavus]MBS2968526.1 hypothetical protein [Metabacillus flavus]